MLAILVGILMQRLFEAANPARGRYLLYALALPGALALDMVTTLAIADWLIEVILVWIATVWGDPREVELVATAGSVIVMAGLWLSPPDVAFWMGILNRFAAIAVMGTMAYVAKRRRGADEAQRKDLSQAALLPDMLPMCASCKSIRSESGEWRTPEAYLLTHCGVRFTHGLCPPCAEKYRVGL